MKIETRSDIEKMFNQVQDFLAGEGQGPDPVAGPKQVDFQNRPSIVPERYLLKDNLLLLLKEP